MSLKIERVTKLFGGFLALDAVSIEVPAGALYGLIGPNGAGKSTLFTVVSGFQSANKGEVTFDGAALDRLSAPARVRRGLGRTFQVPREFRHLSVRENLSVAAPMQAGENIFNVFFRQGRIRDQEAAIAQEVEETLAFLNLDEVAEQPAGTLSGGQKKLLELGRALMAKPRMILLDEPFAGVNPVLVEKISRRIRELHARGMGFLVVEHNLQALRALAEYLYVMDRGRILAAGGPEEVLGDPKVREAYMGGIV
jgi:branched-chain amino acid transport system ATP-binding protein